jgi:hypothetical protein
VQADDGEFVVAEPSRLIEQVIGHRQLAHVMQQPAESQ